MVPTPEFPKPDNLVYWVLAAMAGALVGGVTFALLVKYDPL